MAELDHGKDLPWATCFLFVVVGFFSFLEDIKGAWREAEHWDHESQETAAQMQAALVAIMTPGEKGSWRKAESGTVWRSQSAQREVRGGY